MRMRAEGQLPGMGGTGHFSRSSFPRERNRSNFIALTCYTDIATGATGRPFRCHRWSSSNSTCYTLHRWSYGRCRVREVPRRGPCRLRRQRSLTGYRRGCRRSGRQRRQEHHLPTRRNPKGSRLFCYCPAILSAHLQPMCLLSYSPTNNSRE